jgi:hypothetical protein
LQYDILTDLFVKKMRIVDVAEKRNVTEQRIANIITRSGNKLKQFLMLKKFLKQ